MGTSSPEEPDRPTEFERLHARTRRHAAEFVGLTVEQAQALGTELGLVLRVIVGGENGWYTSDGRSDRITAYARDGVVTRAVAV